MSPGPIRFGHQATVSSADGPGSRLTPSEWNSKRIRSMRVRCKKSLAKLIIIQAWYYLDFCVQPAILGPALYWWGETGGLFTVIEMFMYCDNRCWLWCAEHLKQSKCGQKTNRNIIMDMWIWFFFNFLRRVVGRQSMNNCTQYGAFHSFSHTKIIEQLISWSK